MLTRTWKEAGADHLGLIAAGVSFYAFLAFVPVLAAIVLVYGLVTKPLSVADNMTRLVQVMPKDVAQLIGEQMMGIVQTSGDKKGIGLALALGVALFGARNAAGAIITALNIAYETREKRGFIEVNVLAIAITLATVLLAVTGMVGVAGFIKLKSLLPDVDPTIQNMLQGIYYLLQLLLGSAVAASLYRFGPSRANIHWTWFTPGSLLFGLAWVSFTLGFGIYAIHFGNYNETYGSLAGVVIFLTWMYLSSYALLFGAELNFEFEQRASPTS